MSLSSKITLVTSLSITAGIIGYVHYKQTLDKEKLHEGVIRDMERQKQRSLENANNLQNSSNVTKQPTDWRITTQPN